MHVSPTWCCEDAVCIVAEDVLLHTALAQEGLHRHPAGVLLQRAAGQMVHAYGHWGRPATPPTMVCL